MEPNFTGADLFGVEEESILCVSDSLGFAVPDPLLRDPSKQENGFAETAKFISQILMEENSEQSPFYDSLSLQLTEKSFYDALTSKLPLSPAVDALVPCSQAETTTSNNNNENSSELRLPSPDSVSAFEFNVNAFSQQPPITVSNGRSYLDSHIANLLAQDIFNVADSVSQFRKGLEEASKFLPPGPNLVIGLDSKTEQPINKFGDYSCELKGRKNHERQEIDTGEEEEEGRSHKQSALSLADESNLSNAIDRVFLSVENVCMEHTFWQNGALKIEESDGGNVILKNKEGRRKR